MPQRNSSTATTDQATITEALRFGGIVLPPTATVLGVHSDKGIDQLYRLVLQIDPGSVDALLSGSGFTTPLEAGRQVFMSPVEGFTPASPTKVASAQDTLPPRDDRDQTVTREVLVDSSDPARTLVHLWLFTT
ncbi:MAG: hypothetical protein ACRD0K_27285 [Egibacteraceae bacterium]